MLAHTFDSPAGRMTAVESDGLLIHIAFDGIGGIPQGTSDLLVETERQICEYLSRGRRDFDLPIGFKGAPFATDVMEAMRRIPYGTVVTYSELAEMSGHPGAQRAVGNACARNPLPIVVPCHRVVPSGKGIGNYSGPPGMKRILLRIEGYLPEVP